MNKRLSLRRSYSDSCVSGEKDEVDFPLSYLQRGASEGNLSRMPEVENVRLEKFCTCPKKNAQTQRSRVAPVLGSEFMRVTSPELSEYRPPRTAAGVKRAHQNDNCTAQNNENLANGPANKAPK